LGDVVADTHHLALPAELSPGAYRIAVGFYDRASGQRVERLDGQGSSIEWAVTVAP
jgi:hypothetical protein